MLGFINMICLESISHVLDNRMPYGRCDCNKVVDVISVCFNLYNAAFIYSCLQMKKKSHHPSEL